MGLPIGQAPVTLNTVAGTSRVRPVSFFERTERKPVRLLGGGDSEGKGLFGRGGRDSVRLGGGAEVLSSPAAALNVVSRTVVDSKRLVPSISELQIGFRKHVSDSRAQSREQFQAQLLGGGDRKLLEVPKASSNFEPRKVKRIEIRLPDPSAQARNFINALNDVSGELQAKFSGEAAAPRGGASFQVNGETFPIRNGVPGSRLNITV